jgi:Flp pilus assembly pilin Flp
MIKTLFSRLITENEGAAASEYAILVAVIAVAVFAASKLFDISSAFVAVSSIVSGCVTATGATC